MRQYLRNAIQDDARRVGQRDCLLLETRRAGGPRRPRESRRPVRRLAQLLFRQAGTPTAS